MEKYSCRICGYSTISSEYLSYGLCDICYEKIRILAPISQQIRESLERERIAIRT